MSDVATAAERVRHGGDVNSWRENVSKIPTSARCFAKTSQQPPDALLGMRLRLSVTDHYCTTLDRRVVFCSRRLLGIPNELRRPTTITVSKGPFVDYPVSDWINN